MILINLAYFCLLEVAIIKICREFLNLYNEIIRIYDKEEINNHENLLTL